MNALPKLVSPDLVLDPIIALAFAELCELVRAQGARMDVFEKSNAGRRSGAEEDLLPRPPGIWVRRKDAWLGVGRTDQWLRKWLNKENGIAEIIEGGTSFVKMEDVLKVHGRVNVRRAPE
jgi:hypothetical protein